MGFLCTFKINIEHQILESGSTKKNSDHIQINIKMPTPIQEHPASSKVPNQDIKDMDVPYTFKFKIESQNCSSPSKEKLSCLGEHYYHKILLVYLHEYEYEYEYHHQLAIYSPGQQKKLITLPFSLG